jgi:cytochrome c oxidase subunit 2
MADHHGVKSAISTHLEFSVVLIEAVLLLGFAIPLWAKRVNDFPTGQDALMVHVVGQQFSWNYQLAGPDGEFGRRNVDLVTNSNPMGVDPHDAAGKDDIITLGELHVPVNRPVILELSSKDVIHNFALVNMRIASDAIPGTLNPMWFKPIRTGTYEVICGQLCGLGHYGMKGTLVVDTPEDYQAWLKERAELGAPAAPPPTQRPPGEPPPGSTPGSIPQPGGEQSQQEKPGGH